MEGIVDGWSHLGIWLGAYWRRSGKRISRYCDIYRPFFFCFFWKYLFWILLLVLLLLVRFWIWFGFLILVWDFIFVCGWFGFLIFYFCLWLFGFDFGLKFYFIFVGFGLDFGWRLILFFALGCIGVVLFLYLFLIWFWGFILIWFWGFIFVSAFVFCFGLYWSCFVFVFDFDLVFGFDLVFCFHICFCSVFSTCCFQLLTRQQPLKKKKKSCTLIGLNMSKTKLGWKNQNKLRWRSFTVTNKVPIFWKAKFAITKSKEWIGCCTRGGKVTSQNLKMSKISGSQNMLKNKNVKNVNALTI